jgi:CheY-like chemotaxis protein
VAAIRGAGDWHFVLLGDQPNGDERDPLGFDEVAEDLAALILDSRESTPFTLGIEAAWGMGKSTLMGRLCARLAEEKDVTPVMFNAWTADDGHALEGLVKTVLNELDPSALRRALRDERLIGGLRMALGVLAGFFGLGNLVDTFWTRVAADPRARNDLRKLVGEAVRDWRDRQPELGRGRLLCVFVDDLDRCSPQGVLSVFEAMKLYLDVPGLVFVVGYDQDIVSDLVLREKGYSSEAIEARDYLEKFIQIVHRIPRAKEKRAKKLVASLLEASGTGELLGAPEREIVIEGSASNPRRIKRFVNGFVLTYALNYRWRQFEPQALIRVQLLQMYFQKFARLLEAADRDPIEEFLEYRTARATLRREGREQWEQVHRVLERYGLPVLDPQADLDFPAILDRLEEAIPIAFAALADHRDFTALVKSLAEAPDWPKLRKALGESEFPGASARPSRKNYAPEFQLEGLRVLLVEAEPDPVELLEDLLWKAGSSLTIVGTGSVGAITALREFDVVILDMRGRDPKAGLDAVEKLRRSDRRQPRAILLTPDFPTARLRRARELRVAVVSDTSELFEHLEAMATRLRGLSRP